MFRVMIVEDEPPIMRSVKSAIEKTDGDFSVDACCINGREAIDMLEREDYDVVITDIRMPVLSGLELAKWIVENKPYIKTVILSGYQDFEYAREALRCKALDYILKPLSKDRVRSVLDRLKSELASNKQPPETRDEELDTVVILMCAGAYLLYGANMLLPGERFWVDEKTESIMSGILDKGEDYIFFNSNMQSERILVVGAAGVERQQEIAERLYNAVNTGELPVTVVYKKGIKLKNSGKVIHELRAQLIKHLILERKQLICCDGTEDSYENIGQPYSKGDIEELASAIKSGKRDIVKDKLTGIMASMRETLSTQEEISGMLNIVLDTYALNYPKAMERKNMSVKGDLVNAIAGFTTYEMLIDDVTAIFMSLRSDYAGEDRHGRLADEIEEYLKSNYNKSITNELLSKKFGFVPSYISRIFKLRKGVSPSEYLTKYRIKVAKKLLTDDPDMMVKEVADIVGFKESYYFSKTFKRETGMWPTEFVSG